MLTPSLWERIWRGQATGAQIPAYQIIECVSGTNSHLLWVTWGQWEPPGPKAARTASAYLTQEVLGKQRLCC
jgi:hypothetical protein